MKKGSEWEKAHSPKELPTKARSTHLHPPNLNQPQSALSDLFSGYGSLIFTDQIARGTKNIENYALKHTTQNKTLSIPSYSSASLSVQYFYHSYMLSCRTILIFFEYLNITRHIESQCQSFPPAGINSIGLRFREVFLERDLTVRPGLRTRFLYINQTKRERETHSQVFSAMLICLKSTNNRTKMLGYLCSCSHLQRNQSCICICKIPLCFYNLRSCYTHDFFHRIR